MHEGVFAEQLRAPCCVSLLVSCTEILSDEGPVAFREVAVVDLFRIV